MQIEVSSSRAQSTNPTNMGKAKHKGEKTCKACGKPVKGHEGQTGYRQCVYYNNLRRSRRSTSEEAGNPTPTPTNSSQEGTNSQVSTFNVYENDSSKNARKSRSTERSTEKSRSIERNRNRSRSIEPRKTRRSLSLNNTVNPGRDKIHSETSPLKQTLKELMLQVAELRMEVKDLRGNQRLGEDTSKRRAALRDEGTRRASRSRSHDVTSPATQAGRPHAVALSFSDDSDIEEPTETYSRPTIPGLKPVPSNIDLSKLKSAKNIPEKTAKLALKGEFTDLCTLCDNIEITTTNEAFEFVNENGNVCLKQKIQKKRINNYASWLQAWNKYEKLMTEFHGIEVYLHLADYKMRILEFDRIYQWNSIFMFDKNHRKDLGGISIEFCNLSHVNMTTNLNSNSLKNSGSNNTSESKSYFCTPNVPFRPAPGTQAGRRNPSLANNGQPEICNNYNKYKCTLQPCPRLHICASCGGDAPFSVCSKYGFCSNKNQKPQNFRYQ